MRRTLLNKRGFASLILVIVCNITMAKGDSLAKVTKIYKNTITLSAANFSIYNLTPFDTRFVFGWVANQFGISAERKYDKHLVLAVSYNVWNIVPFLNKTENRVDNAPIKQHDYDHRYIYGEPNYDSIGALRYRYGYKMLDATVSYRLDKFKRHKLLGGVGISYTWGVDLRLLARLYYSTGPTDYFNKMSWDHKSYTGVIIPVKYDFLFWKNKMSAGIQGSARKYFGLYSWQMDYGVHIGINF